MNRRDFLGSSIAASLNILPKSILEPKQKVYTPEEMARVFFNAIVDGAAINRNCVIFHKYLTISGTLIGPDDDNDPYEQSGIKVFNDYHSGRSSNIQSNNPDEISIYSAGIIFSTINIQGPKIIRKLGHDFCRPENAIATLNFADKNKNTFLLNSFIGYSLENKMNIYARKDDSWTFLSSLRYQSAFD